MVTDSELTQIQMRRAWEADVMYGKSHLRDIVEELCTLNAVISQYELLGFDVPKSMIEARATQIRRAQHAYRENLEAQLIAAKRKAEELKSKEMQREEAEKEVARLTALRGQ